MALTNICYISVKVERDKQLVCIDELLEDVSMEELQEFLPGHQPRYIAYSYRMQHQDGRVSYPMCFIYFTPRGKVVRRELIISFHRLNK